MKPKQTEMDLGVTFKPPTLKEVALYAILVLDLPLIEAEKFHAYYSANGWKVGRNKMKSWKDALNHWRLVWKGKAGERTKTAFHYKTVLEAKQRIADEIRNRYAYQAAGGWDWSNAEKKKEWIELKRQIREINEQIANL